MCHSFCPLSDLAYFRGSLWHGAGGRFAKEIVRVLESVLERDPDHAGANHYYIHAVEASSDPERALPSAHRLDTMVPKAGHLVHMPAHIYERTGNYEEAARNNAEAAKVDRAYAVEAGKTGSMYDLMYHSHNEHFEAMAASMAGRYAEARKAADNMTARLMPHVKTMPMLDTFIMAPIWVDVRFNKWTEVLARPEPSKELLGTHAMWRYSRALAFASEGKIGEAEKEKALFEAETAAIPPETMLGEFNKAQDVLRLAGHVIEARIAAAKKENDAALQHWREAIAIQDTLNYDEPADWYYPVRESLGAALLANGKLAGMTDNVGVNRYQIGGGMFITPNVLMKGEWVNQKYNDFPTSDIRNGGKFKGFMVEGVVAF